MRVGIITGASSGMGKKFALKLTNYFSRIDEVWLIARSNDKLEQLAKEIQIKCKIITLDLLDEQQLVEFCEIIKKEKPQIEVLINCAGFGIVGDFTEISLEEQRNIIQLNCSALVAITYYCIPYMIKNSRIIQLASVAAFLPQPNFAIYAASKSFVLSFSRALREELRTKQIIVTAVCPGPVNTEFFENAEKYGTALSIKKFIMVEPNKVVSGALKASLHKRKVFVYSIPMKGLHCITKIVPCSFVLFVLRHIKRNKK